MFAQVESNSLSAIL